MNPERDGSESPGPQGDPLAPILAQYPILRKIAARAGAKVGARTLQATAIVNEALLRIMKMMESGKDLPQDPQHQLSLCARIIQQVAMDDWRRRKRQRHGNGRRPVHLDKALGLVNKSPAQDVDLEAVDLAIRRFEERFSEDRRELIVFRLRFFSGMSNSEVADTLGVTTRTVERHMEVIRAWFNLELRGPSEGEGQSRSPSGS